MAELSESLAIAIHDFAAARDLASSFRLQGKLPEAIACYRRALELKPDDAEAYNDLGVVLTDAGKLDEGIACYQQAVRLRPGLAQAHSNLGVAYREIGRPEEAAACHRTALKLRPDLAAIHNNLGNALGDQGRRNESIECYRRAIELQPTFADAWRNLGNALGDQRKLDEAVECHRQALTLQPDFSEAYASLGIILTYQGKLNEAIDCHRKALALKPDPQACSNLLFTQQYCPEMTLQDFAAAHAEYQRQYAAPLSATWRRHENGRQTDRPLRLGFVSPDFGSHPVGFFLIRVLENLDRTECETVCYSDRIIRDDLTARFQKAATSWREVHGTSDHRLAEMIRADGIDILFDLAGHTTKNRLLVFARKPAPIQITWLGYVDTTGLRAMDYLLADAREVPPGAEAHYAEQVLRLPDGYVCYDPPAYAPLVGPLPAIENGFVTFGSFNNGAKINEHVIKRWSEILKRVPGSGLSLKYAGMDEGSLRDWLQPAFASNGVDPSRVLLLPGSQHSALLAEYNHVDLALDTFPYGGGLTTCEALWMGVPVVTCPGETFASRHSLSHLTAAGLTQTIARNFDEYVELAVVLAGDLPRLAAMRAGLRAQVAASPLCDGPRFAENLMRLLRDIWRRSTVG